MALLPESEPESVDISHELDMVPVFSSSNHDGEMEAMNVHAILEANGIESLMVGPSTIPSLEFQVQVSKADLETAQRLLAEAQEAGALPRRKPRLLQKARCSSASGALPSAPDHRAIFISSLSPVALDGDQTIQVGSQNTGLQRFEPPQHVAVGVAVRVLEAIRDQSIRGPRSFEESFRAGSAAAVVRHL